MPPFAPGLDRVVWWFQRFRLCSARAVQPLERATARTLNAETPLQTLTQITSAWVSGRIDDIAAFIHPDAVTVFYGLRERMRGRDLLLDHFRDFARSATVVEFIETDHKTDVVGGVGVVTFRFDLVYDRRGLRYLCRAVETWTFERTADGWVAVWRAILHLHEDAFVLDDADGRNECEDRRPALPEACRTAGAPRHFDGRLSRVLEPFYEHQRPTRWHRTPKN